MLASNAWCCAQNPNFVNAYNSLTRNSVDSAKMFIDKAILDSSTHKDPQFWYVRSFIYKELYKKYEMANKLSVYRDTAVSDLFVSVKLDSSDANKKDNYVTAKFLAGCYYNDASDMLDSLHYTTAKKYFGLFKATEMHMGAVSNVPSLEIPFDLKLGDLYSYLFFHALNDKTKKAFLDSAKNSYNGVLAINPNNVSANYNLAILFYNQAVYIINETNYDDDISKLNAAQDTSIHLAMQSLPFMQKTYQLDPGKKEAIKGLEGIYYLLHDTQKFQEYEDKLKELEGGK